MIRKFEESELIKTGLITQYKSCQEHYKEIQI